VRKVFRKVRKDFPQSIFDIQYSCVSNSPPSLKGGVAVGRGGSVDSHQCLLIASFPEVISPHKSQLRNNLSELSAGTIFSLCVFFAKPLRALRFAFLSSAEICGNHFPPLRFLCETFALFAVCFSDFCEICGNHFPLCALCETFALFAVCFSLLLRQSAKSAGKILYYFHFFCHICKKDGLGMIWSDKFFRTTCGNFEFRESQIIPYF